MDPVDVLTMAATAARFIRSSADPEAVLTAAYRALDLEPPSDSADSFAVRVARLADAAGARREELFDFLGSRAGPLPGNRRIPDESEADLLADPDPEAERLAEWAGGEPEGGRDLFPEGFGSFGVAERKIDHSFGGRYFVIRGGQRLPLEKAGGLRQGDSLTSEPEGLPPVVRGVIDYPLQRAALFTIEVGEEPWSVWDICTAFADQYARIYEHPERHGVWGHDLGDLVIERLIYYPQERLIYASVGS